MGKLFGTDGIRGIVGEDLTSKLAMNVGESSAYVLGNESSMKVVVGRDTRISGQMLSDALKAGLMSQGANVIDLGVVTTPAVSYLVEKYGCDMGAMISASHNPSEYNGIKLFNNEGFKLPDEVENEIEKYLFGKAIPSSSNIGKELLAEKAIDDYVNHLISTSKYINPNLKIIIDCAYGSASETAPLLFEKLGINAEFMNYKYDGYNINNNAGSTHLEGLINRVKETKADVGIAYDGDADRCLMIDEKGNVVDGDQIMAISSLYFKKEGNLKNNTLVGTVMSNLGLVKFCEANEINFEKTKVGDRYVLEKMLEKDYIIGGEQSGHIIYKNYANTGDGALTSIQILNIMSRENKSLSKLASIMKKYPQVLVNVDVNDVGKQKFKDDLEIIDIINNIEKELGSDGRILVRPSGTENLIRVMIEGLDEEDITKKANQAALVLTKKYGIKK